MKLIGSLTSPYTRKVRVVMTEKRIDCSFEIQDPWSADTRVPGFNPLGKVPVLLLDDGTPLFDSRVIVEYLDGLTPVSRLIPDNGRARVMVRRWEALADGVLDAGIAVFYENKRSASRRSKDWIARQQGKVAAGLQMMAEELGDKTWCYGEAYSLADVASGCCLGWLSLRFPELEWGGTYPNLAKHYEKLLRRQSFADTRPPAPQ
jgi:glutathione S-transferase